MRAFDSGTVALRLLIILVAGAAGHRAAVPARSAHRAAQNAVSAARRWMRSLTLHDKIAQLIFIPFHGAAPNSATREYRQFVRLVRDTHVGGLVLVNWSNGRVIQKAEPYALAAFVNRMQRLAPDSADRHRRFRTRRFHARGRHHGISARHGFRRHRRSRRWRDTKAWSRPAKRAR